MLRDVFLKTLWTPGVLSVIERDRDENDAARVGSSWLKPHRWMTLIDCCAVVTGHEVSVMPPYSWKSLRNCPFVVAISLYFPFSLSLSFFIKLFVTFCNFQRELRIHSKNLSIHKCIKSALCKKLLRESTSFRLSIGMDAYRITTSQIARIKTEITKYPFRYLQEKIFFNLKKYFSFYFLCNMVWLFINAI